MVHPDGLAGENIPEEARILAVADAYDAMSSHRSYRADLTQEEIREEIERNAGTQFDPRIVDAFLNAKDSVLKVAREHSQRENTVETPPDSQAD